MKKLLFLLLFAFSFLSQAQLNSIPIIEEEKFNSISPTANPVVFVIGKNGYRGTIWKLIPNDRRSPESDSIRKHSSGLRYQRVTLAGAASDPNNVQIYRPTKTTMYPEGTVAAWINSYTIGGSNIFWKNNRLGVGTNAPAYPLDLYGNLRVKTGANQNFVVKSYISGSAGLSLSAENDTAGRVPVEYHGSQFAFLYGSNVYFNTLTPTGEYFVVNGTVYLKSTTKLGGSLFPDGNLSVSIGNTAAAFNNLYIRRILGSGSNELQISSQSTNNVSFYTNNNSSLRMTILGAGGNVGINTASPTSKLDIVGANGYNQLRLRTDYTPTDTSDINGNVGDFASDDNYLYKKTAAGWKRMGTFSTF
ncbi:hypothetical protein [Runella sp.]|uniref:hypothetical protein n=1 Tax=Runella sp. TaxID=1960881 RepID=UPI003D1148E4